MRWPFARSLRAFSSSLFVGLQTASFWHTRLPACKQAAQLDFSVAQGSRDTQCKTSFSARPSGNLVSISRLRPDSNFGHSASVKNILKPVIRMKTTVYKTKPYPSHTSTFTKKRLYWVFMGFFKSPDGSQWTASSQQPLFLTEHQTPSYWAMPGWSYALCRSASFWSSSSFSAPCKL